MELKSKQQVVFIARKLWAGGAEKVLYYLAHNLDHEKFDPVVIFMIWQDDIPVQYDQSIPLFCLGKGSEQITDYSVNRNSVPNSINSYSEPRPEEPPQIRHTRSGLLQIVGKTAFSLYRRLPQKLKERISVRKRIAQIMAYDDRPSSNDHQNQAEQEEIKAIGLNPLFDANAIATSIGINMPDVVMMNRILQKVVRDDAIFISMQEEPTVRMWITQMYGAHRYIAYSCAPESIHMPLIYPDKNRLIVENWLFANALRNANAVIVPNNWMSDDMVKSYGVDKKRVQIVANPVDCELIKKKMDQSLPEGFILPDRKTLFVQLARVDDQKNHVLLVEACRILITRYPDFLMLIIGNGNEFNNVQKLINEYGLETHLLMMGESSNPYPFLSKARASILTSKWEASPLVLIDSMLCGAVPVSVDCVAGPRDMIGENQYGLLVPPDDPQALADAMYQIATDDDLHQTLKNRALIKAWDYDIQKIVREWEDLILKVASDEN